MDKIRYTIVAFASPDIQKLLGEFREQFNIPFNAGTAIRRCILKDVAHISIKRTFFLKQDKKEEELAKRMGELSAHDDILVHGSEAGVFTNTAYGEVIHVKIGHNAQLEKLHLDIKQKIDDMVETKNINTEGDNYLPHVTLAYNFPKEMVAEARKYIGAKILPCDFYIRQIDLLRDYDAEKDEREVVATYDLA